MTLQGAIELAERRREEIKRKEKLERDDMMGAICRLLDLGKDDDIAPNVILQ